MKTPHKHAELIKAWADGADIQVLQHDTVWLDCIDPYWADHVQYRIKPEPKPEQETKYMYLNWQDGENKWFITASPFKCTKFRFKVEPL